MIFMEADLSWIVRNCAIPVLRQGVWITAPVIFTAALLRACVLLRLPAGLVHIIGASMGLAVLWFFYSNGVVYFIALSAIVYALLTVRRHKGVAVVVASLLFLFIW